MDLSPFFVLNYDNLFTIPQSFFCKNDSSLYTREPDITFSFIIKLRRRPEFLHSALCTQHLKIPC